MNIRWGKLYSGSLGAFHASPRAASQAERRERTFQRVAVAAVICGIAGFLLLSVGAAIAAL